MKHRVNYWMDDLTGVLLKSSLVLFGVTAVAGLVAAGSSIANTVKLDKKVAADLGYKTVSVTGVDAYKKGEDHYVVLTAKGETKNGEKAEFVAGEYKTDEERFNALLKSIGEVEDLHSVDVYAPHIIDNILDVVENGKLTNKAERKDITYTNEGQGQILNISTAKVDGNKVYYYVVSLQEAENDKGEIGLVTQVDKVSFELTPELAKDPNKVFSMGDRGATIEAVGHRFVEFDTQNYKVSVTNPKSR